MSFSSEERLKLYLLMEISRMTIREWVVDKPEYTIPITNDALAVLVTALLEHDDNDLLYNVIFMLDNRLSQSEYDELESVVTDMLDCSGITDFVRGQKDPVVDCVVEGRSLIVSVYS